MDRYEDKRRERLLVLEVRHDVPGYWDRDTAALLFDPQSKEYIAAWGYDEDSKTWESGPICRTLDGALSMMPPRDVDGLDPADSPWLDEGELLQRAGAAKKLIDMGIADDHAREVYSSCQETLQHIYGGDALAVVVPVDGDPRPVWLTTIENESDPGCFDLHDDLKDASQLGGLDVSSLEYMQPLVPGDYPETDRLSIRDSLHREDYRFDNIFDTGQMCILTTGGEKGAAANRAVYASGAMVRAGVVRQMDGGQRAWIGDLLTVLNGDIVVTGFDYGQSNLNRGLSQQEARDVRDYFTLISGPGSGADALAEREAERGRGIDEIAVEKREEATRGTEAVPEGPEREAGTPAPIKR